MRKRLIGKAFAVAMSGAMVFTASPVTANIFHVASIVKAAEADQSEEWTYCYAGLTWNEYWTSEGVYAAGNDSSSTEIDSNKETDKGGYDAVTRATTNHGLHRGSFQCTTTIYTEDNAYTIVSWGDKVDKLDENGNPTYDNRGNKIQYTLLNLLDKNGQAVQVKFLSGELTFSDNTVKKMINYKVSGLKYVPVKIKTSDYDEFKAKYSVVENNGTLIGGYSEDQLSSYELTANVTENTNGLKTATKNSDGSFSFSQRTTGTESGIKDQTLVKADNITPEVKSASGKFGEFLRVDLTGDGYGALGDKMQAVKWTYYGNDSSRKNVLATYGTKFAADNWMHKSMGIQLGLTDSIRCQLPKDTDGTGYWSLTVYALGYEDYTINFEATKDHIVVTSTPATDEEKASLKKLASDASALSKDSYCGKDTNRDELFINLQEELNETTALLASSDLSSADVTEQITHLTDITDKIKALKKHDLETITTPATTTKEGSIVVKCKNCGEIISTKTLEKLKESATTTATKPAATTTVTNKTQVKAPAETTVKLSKAKKTSIKVSWKKVSGASAYQIQYSTSKNFNKAKTVKVSAKSASKVLKKLKKNKKYYVRVRSYKTVKVNKKNTNVYSAWSAKKALKTKKK